MAKFLDVILTTLYKVMISIVQEEGRLAALTSLGGEALLVQQAANVYFYRKLLCILRTLHSNLPPF